MTDLSVHARMVIAVPVCFAAESALEYHCDLAMARFERGHFVGDDEAPRVEALLSKALRRRDRVGPELTLMLVAWGICTTALIRGGAPLGWVHAATTARGLPSVWLWYGLVALPIFQFLFGRWLWRWALWALVLFELSRLRLRLMPTHPDQGGGIVHLSNPIAAFCLFLAGQSAVLAASWYSHIALGLARAREYIPALCVFFFVAECAALWPLLPFLPNLGRARRLAITHYDALALYVTRAFNRRWIEKAPDDSILDHADVSVLTDLMSSYAGLKGMRVVPFHPRVSIAIAVAVLVPMLPLLTTEIPLPALLTKLLRALLA
jgi:hypothetical protein